MEIKITGNKESYYLTQNISYLNISLNGDFDLSAFSRVQLNYNESNFSFENRNRVYEFAERIKGANRENIIFLLREFDFPHDFCNSFFEKSQTEISLFKAIFLIEYWIDLYLAKTSSSLFNIEKIIYDDFVVDLKNTPGSQQDLYFIRKKIITRNNEPLLKRLMEINLLVELKVKSHQAEIVTYFIPLLKPGIPKKYFNSNFADSENRTYSLWKTILEDRDFRLKTWFENR